ncbi:hypothetical protein WDZ92_35135 [Nostoc sp. NIES-2111]
MQRLSTEGVEPVSLDEAKQAARVDNDLGASSSLDGLIATLITTAREQAEQLTGQLYRPQVWRTELDDWPSVDLVLPIYRATACAVSYWNGATFVLLSGGYLYAAGGAGGAGTVLAPATGAWPMLGTRAVGARVRIDLTGGPESPAAVPASVKTYILATVAAWLKTPEALASAALGPHPLFVSLLNGEKLFS